MSPTLMGAGSSMAGTKMVVSLLSTGVLVVKVTVVVVVVEGGGCGRRRSGGGGGLFSQFGQVHVTYNKIRRFFFGTEPRDDTNLRGCISVSTILPRVGDGEFFAS